MLNACPVLELELELKLNVHAHAEQQNAVVQTQVQQNAVAQTQVLQNVVEGLQVQKLELGDKPCSYACLSIQIGNERVVELDNCAKEEEQELDSCLSDGDGGGGCGGGDGGGDGLAQDEEMDQVNYCLHYSENVGKKWKVGPALLYQIQCG